MTHPMEPADQIRRLAEDAQAQADRYPHKSYAHIAAAHEAQAYRKAWVIMTGRYWNGWDETPSESGPITRGWNEPIPLPSAEEVRAALRAGVRP